MPATTIDFEAARRRIQRMATDRETYVEVEFDAAELAAPFNLLTMLRECTEQVGTFGVREELLKPKRLVDRVFIEWERLPNGVWSHKVLQRLMEE